MGYLEIELSRTFDEDRFREAERCRHINEALAIRKRQSPNRAQILARWLQSLIKQEQRIATEHQARALAEMS